MLEKIDFNYDWGKINQCYNNPQKGLLHLNGLEIAVKEIKNETINEKMKQLKSFFEGNIKIEKKEYSEILYTIKKMYTHTCV